MKSHWITHKGKKIFYADYSNLGADTASLRAEAQAVVDVVSQEPPQTVLTLSNVEGTMGTPTALAIMEDTASKLNAHSQKRAVIGLSGLRKQFLTIVNKIASHNPLVAFDDIEQAKDWLVSD